MNAQPPAIPAGCEEFAKAAAALAEEHGIRAFEMTMTPAIDRSNLASGGVRGEIKVSYWSTDGRGRPSRNIRVVYDVCVELAVEYTAESTD